MSSPRELTRWERSILSRLLEELFSESHPFSRQLESVIVAEEYGPGDPTVALRVEDPTVRRGEERLGPIASATATDCDGCVIDVLVHVREGKLDELVLYRVDGETIRELPLAVKLTNIFNPHKGFEESDLTP